MAIAARGLTAATGRFEASAMRMAAGKTAGLAAELVAQDMAEADFAANLSVIEAAEKTTKRLLDILV